MNVVCFYFSFFFFSSRRRHTRCSRDWSSDVCSSDLQTIDLTWTDNSAFEDGYEVQRCCQTGWIVVASLPANARSEEHTSELQSRLHLVCRLLLEKKK